MTARFLAGIDFNAAVKYGAKRARLPQFLDNLVRLGFAGIVDSPPRSRSSQSKAAAYASAAALAGFKTNLETFFRLDPDEPEKNLHLLENWSMLDSFSKARCRPIIELSDKSVDFTAVQLFSAFCDRVRLVWKREPIECVSHSGHTVPILVGPKPFSPRPSMLIYSSSLLYSDGCLASAIKLGIEVSCGFDLNYVVEKISLLKEIKSNSDIQLVAFIDGSALAENLNNNLSLLEIVHAQVKVLKTSPEQLFEICERFVFLIGKPQLFELLNDPG